ncbi:FKBP-type peptidyl-prolyl cis-trans isomerase [Streptomyces luteolus]|uniref:Peptidyl-prolyl cis-trans isomerase n=1 Tax=Streptomyces luteolus TaxID=3043615 RepID=A0ABT6T8B2_9ACTN|nr:FKBP-type peptidyl-prolyl cis-trans isomerase [Streptomyces sp. B-S-A12]MDI3424114.1 FKBP-type peptidyl-prolyl cis-trans isomerase [Streptomyces sp. B-S-A12]
MLVTMYVSALVRSAALGLIVTLAVGCVSSAPENIPQVRGEFGRRPTVTVPDLPPPEDARMKVLSQGDGPVTREGQVVVTDVDMRLWEGNKPLMDTYRLGQPTTAVLDGRHVARTWDQALLGRSAGSRVLMVAPASYGFGPNGMAPAQVAPGEHLIVTFDVIGGYDPRQQVAEGSPEDMGGRGTVPAVRVKPGKEPEITTWGQAPRQLRARTLVSGKGASIAEGDTVVVQWSGWSWGNKEPFASTYRRSGPNGFLVKKQTVPPGWHEALKGRTVGSRLLLAVPKSQDPSFTTTKGGVGVPQDADIVYVIDILDRRAR